MFPLLALGLLGGAGWLNQRAYDERKAAGAERVQGLLGSAPREMGPPTEDGAMGQMPGQGLLGNMADPATQAQFMQGLLTLPRAQAERASQMYGDLFNRVQQAGQFDRSQKQQAGQFDRSERRLGEQFTASQGQQASQFTASQAQQASQFGQTFGLQSTEAAQRNAIAQAQLGLERQRLALAQSQASAKGSGVPELAKGWMYTQAGNGQVVAMPIPGTKDYADVTGTEQSLAGAIANIGRFVDVYAGKKQGEHGVRVGGSGNVWSGETAGQLSSIRAKVIADIAKLREMGVLQEGEAKRLEGQLTDPTTYGATFSTSKGTVAAYEELQKQFASKLVAHRNANPWLLPPPPPGAVIDGGAAPRPPSAQPRPSGGGGAGAAASAAPPPAAVPPAETAFGRGLLGVFPGLNAR